MFPSINPTTTTAWQQLQAHYSTIRPLHLRSLFAQDPKRFRKFSLQFEDILLDYAKNRITEETLSLLLQLARECRLPEAIEAMFGGEKINFTESRQVLHIALRNQAIPLLK
ncbi:Glucose-6-phosphate isomerase [Cesiribacter andamanensis AMV16]|uniref:Glucose-6-phosphate isomerase n=1 Tax=Cesiribacter andamanensis AMV16 TaxID=1279009 RepID=M7N516_9BACT|nr:Glucose-6-phosphate isomerase [Cesiribacter andamanensis AMV16]